MYITRPLLLGDAAYVAVGYRTWLAMLMLNVLQLSVILLYCVFYRKFMPKVRNLIQLLKEFNLSMFLSQ